MSAWRRPNSLRHAGTAAAVVLSAGSYAALRSGTVPHVVGLAVCLTGLAVLVAVWWLLGRELARLRSGWLTVTGALWTLPLLVAAPLGSRDAYSYACQGWLYSHGMSPYTVSPAAGGCPWLQTVAPVWRDTAAPYGPLAVAVSGAAGWLGVNAVPVRLLVAIGVLRLVALGGAVLAAVAIPRLARVCGVAPAQALWLGLFTPVVAVHAIAGAHHDALLAGLELIALAVVASGMRPLPRALTAGVVLGLAVAVKPTAAVVVPFAVLLAGRRWPAAMLAMAAVASFAATSWLTGLGLGWVHALPEATRIVQWTSVPTGIGMAAGYLLRGVGDPGAIGGAVAVARIAGLGAGLVVDGWFLVRAWHGRASARAVLFCAAGAAAATTVFAPVFYPWYALAPLALLAATVTDTRVRSWLAVAVCVLAFLVLPDGLGLATLTKLPGALADLVLVAALLAQLRERGTGPVRAGRPWLGR